MNKLTMTVCAASVTATPALAGVSPASFVSTLRQVISAEASVDAVEGTISSISEDKTSFVVRLSDNTLKTVKISDETKYTLDGEESTRDRALLVGRTVDAKVNDSGMATEVAVTKKRTP